MALQLTSISFFIQVQALGTDRSYLLQTRAEGLLDGQPLASSCNTLLPLGSFSPGLPREMDLAETLAAIQNARRIGLHAAQAGIDAALWLQALQEEQALWAKMKSVPPALAEFGIHTIRQAVLGRLQQGVEAGFMPLNDWIKSGGMSES